MANTNSIGGIHHEMMRRCYNENCIMYKSYGAKGIRVCDEWHNKESFIKWCNDNGYKPGMKVKRINSSLDYSPKNCVLSTEVIRKPKQYTDVVPEYIRLRREKEQRDKIRESYGVPKSFSRTRIYRVYRGMICRCTPRETANEAYHNANKYYVKRGIKVCDEWLGRIGFYRFYQWSMENGYDDSLSIDRIDNDKGYSPNNCRWIPRGMQDRNKRNNVRYDYHGKKLLLIEICEKEGVSYDALKDRVVKRGQDIDFAINGIRNNPRPRKVNHSDVDPSLPTIVELRKRTGLSQAQFGLKYHIPENTMRNWESGRRKPSETILYLLNRAVKGDYMDTIRKIEVVPNMDEEKVSIQVEDETFEIHFEGWKYFSQKELLFGILSEVNEGLKPQLNDLETHVLFGKLEPIFTV